jgi:hypothetical protein
MHVRQTGWVTWHVTPDKALWAKARRHIVKAIPPGWKLQRVNYRGGYVQCYCEHFSAIRDDPSKGAWIGLIESKLQLLSKQK